MTLQGQAPVSRCAAHPDVETALRCSKCGIPICPRCLIQTPVGGRCAKCANLRTLPIFQVRPLDYLKAAGASLLAAVVIGAVWSAIPYAGFFAFFIAAGIGYAVSEVVNRATRYKKGLGLQIIAGVSVALAYITSRSAPALVFLLRIDALDVTRAAGIIISSFIAALSNPFALLAVCLGIFIAVSRLR